MRGRACVLCALRLVSLFCSSAEVAGACQSSRADRQREGAGAAREAIGGAPSAHVACCGWNHSDGLPAGLPRTVSGRGAIWRFEPHAHVEVSEIARDR